MMWTHTNTHTKALRPAIYASNWQNMAKREYFLAALLLSLSACVASTCVVVSPQKTGEAVPLLAPISTFNHTDGKKEKKTKRKKKKQETKREATCETNNSVSKLIVGTQPPRWWSAGSR